MAQSMPFFRSSPNALAIIPAKVGPDEQPKSPPSARRANIAVPPPFIPADALLNVPGHMMPTEKPHIATPTSPSTAEELSAMSK